jgi:glycine hydroxymethyltransferase
MHSVAAKAIAFGEALRPEFKEYQQQVIDNAQTLADELTARGYRLVSGGTDNHLMMVDLRGPDGPGITGADAEDALHIAGITVNKNLIPFDPEKPMLTSGIRVGTPAVTTRGFKQGEMVRVAGFIDKSLRNTKDANLLTEIRAEVLEMCKQFKIYNF